MVTFKNNNSKRTNFRRNDRNFKNNLDRSKFNNNSFSSNDNFKRKSPGRNNHNASKLIEKYSNLAREALSNGDKILSENYFQHADHFTRIANEQSSLKKVNEIEKLSEDSNQEKVLNNQSDFTKETLKEVN